MIRFCKRAASILLWTLTLLVGIFAATFSADGGREFYTKLFLELTSSQKSYAAQMDVQAYIVTSQQISDIFKDPSQQPVRAPNRELYQKQCYLLVRLENNGGEFAWGTLSCRVPSFGDAIPIDIPAIYRNHRTEFYITALGSVVSLEDPPEELPKVSYRWQRLYVY